MEESILKEKRLRENRMWKERALLLGVGDALSVVISYFLALLLRHDLRFSAIDPMFVNGYIRSILLWTAMTIAVFYACRLYHSIWSMASVAELYRIIIWCRYIWFMLL